MTIEEAREYWSRRLERAAGYSDEHWDAEERHAHADYIDALKHAITALAIYREREEAAKKPKTNGDRIRLMTDDELASRFDDEICLMHMGCHNINCIECALDWLKQEVDPNMTNGDKIRAMTDEELVDVLRCNCCAFHNMPKCAFDCKQGHIIWLKQEVIGDAAERTY